MSKLCEKLLTCILFKNSEAEHSKKIGFQMVSNKNIRNFRTASNPMNFNIRYYQIICGICYVRDTRFANEKGRICYFSENVRRKALNVKIQRRKRSTRGEEKAANSSPVAYQTCPVTPSPSLIGGSMLDSKYGKERMLSL